MKLDKQKIESRQVRNTVISFTGLLSNKTEFISVTEWPNGEGLDVDINSDRQFQMTWDQWEALKKVVKRHVKAP